MSIIIIIVSAGAVRVSVGGGIWQVSRDVAARRPVPHVHEMEIVAVQYPVNLATVFAGAGAGSTVVLGLCRGCSLTVSKTLTGHWTLAQVRGEDETTEEHVCDPGDLTYPYTDGEHLVIGPECFTEATGTVISYKGSNYYRPLSLPDSATPDG